jgi:hypothetical protein
MVAALFALAACQRQPDPRLVDNAEDDGIYSARAESNEMERQGRIFSNAQR